jgi:osmoprotectant transport system ATP-binding protein
MDEPFGALDPIIRAKAQEDLLGVQRKLGTTIILVTHDIDEAFRLGHRVAVMSQGRLLQHDRPEALITRPADPFVSQLIGADDKALKLLSLIPAGSVAESGRVDGPSVPATASLRDVLSELVWRGAAQANVLADDGSIAGHVPLASILARGRAQA